jgi:glycosyltransferase involved in cell wall biosynthesis
MKRVLLVTNNFPPTIGGPATFVDALAHALARRSFRPTVLCSSPVERDATDAGRPFRVRRIALTNRYRFEVAVRIALLLEMARHEAIFVNTLEDYVSEANRLLRRRYTLKVVGDPVWERARNLGATTLDIDEFQADPAARRTWAREMARRDRAVLGAARIVTPSEYLKRLVCRWGVPDDRIAVIRNAVDDEFAGAGAPVSRNGGELRILFVGRLTNWKGVETLLLALRGLDGTRLVVAGAGPQLPAAVELARQLGIADRVEFAGGIRRGEIRSLMEQSHVLVLPSLYEGLSHTLLEAGAMGLALIASTCGGNREVVDDRRDGLLVPPRDVGALQASLGELRDDEQLRLRLALAAQRRATSGRFDDSVDRLVEVLCAND